MVRKIANLAVCAAAAAAALNASVAAAAAPRPADPPSCVRAFDVPPAGDNSPFGVTAGPGGTWYTDGANLNVIAHARTTTYVAPDPSTASLGWLTWNGQGRVWFADRGNGRIGYVTATGTITEVPIPDGANGAAVPQGIVVDHGSVWFTDQQNDRIGRLNVATGAIGFHHTPSAFPLGLVRGGDGELYFTERSVDKVARFDPSTGLFTEWTLPHGAFPNRLTVAPDGTVWFTTLFTSAVWHIAGGYLHRYDIDGGPVGITYWNGHLWAALFSSGQVAEVSLDGTVEQTWTMPDAADAGPLQIAASNGYLWSTGNANVYRVDPTC